MVRHRVLIPAFAGSTPAPPISFTVLRFFDRVGAKVVRIVNSPLLKSIQSLTCRSFSRAAPTVQLGEFDQPC